MWTYPRPFVCTRPYTTARAGLRWTYRARTLASLGDLRSRTKNPGSLDNATYWDVEHPTWSLTHGPTWLALDENTGVLSGVPPAPDTYHVELVVRIGDKTATQGFGITVRRKVPGGGRVTGVTRDDWNMPFPIPLIPGV